MGDVNAGNEKNLPDSDAEQMSQWVIRWSQAVNLNLCPMFEFWQWPLSKNTCAAVKNLTPFLPSDDVTSIGDADRLVSSLEKKYKKLARKTTSKNRCPGFKIS